MRRLCRFRRSPVALSTRPTLVIALVMGSLSAISDTTHAAPRRHATEQTYYLTHEADNCGEDSLALRLRAGGSGGSCGSSFSGPVNEALVHTGQEPEKLTYRALEGVPVVLNARRNVRGTIYVESYGQVIGWGVGPTTLVVEIGGKVGRRTTVIAQDEIEYVADLTDRAVEFDIDIPNRFNKRRLNSLYIALYNRGLAPFHGWYSTTDPTSFLVLPIFSR